MTPLSRKSRTETARIVGIYALFGLAWIYGSDTVIDWLVEDKATLLKVAVAKGFAFIICTATLLYFLINRFLRQVAAANAGRLESLENLRQKNAHLRLFFESAPASLAMFDREMRYLEVSRRWLSVYGLGERNLLGLSHYEVFPEIPERWREFHRRGLAGETIREEADEFWRADGSLQLLRWEIRPWYDAAGEVGGIVIFTEDITDMKRAEEERLRLEAQLQQAQKMESVGRLAGGVAHDFNNLLTVIMGFAQLGMRELEPGHQTLARFDGIRQAAEKSAALTSQLLGFARKQTISPRVLNLNEAVENMLKMLKRLVGEDIEVAWGPGAQLWRVRMDPSQLDQILANLCVNARDAIADVGKITIETRNVVLDYDYGGAQFGFVPGEYVQLALSDNGCGMDRETMANIFEPFFTTKEVGRGTGLGLATVYGIVRQNNGFINTYSEPGAGTTFKIYLPRFAGEDALAVPEPAAAAPRGGDETILLIEDEAGIRDVTVSLLALQGYRVLPAAKPSEALELAREHRDGIDLVVTDVVMPEMNGRDLVRRLMPLCPNAGWLFMSGYTADVIAHHGVLDDGVNFISKPFSMSDLTAKVREVLDAGRRELPGPLPRLDRAASPLQDEEFPSLPR